jgi:long-chain acyl-CoA synthetase
MAFASIPHLIFRQASERPSDPAYYERRGGQWRPTPWQEYANTTRRAARAMIALGVPHGGAVCILGFNRAEWVIFDVAAMAVGAAPAGIYTTSSAEEVQYIVNHCEARIVLLENEAQWKKIDRLREQMPHLKYAVMMSGAPAINDPMVMTWSEFLARGEGANDAELDARLAAIKPKELATLIYTSGTTGPPKGVMLSHENLTWTAAAATDLVKVGPTDCALSYLPLSHIAEQMFSIHVPAATGYAVYYAESIDSVPENLKEVQPTVFFGVPRIWEKFHAGISGKLALATGAKAKLVAWARGIGTEVSNLRMKGLEPSGLLRVQYAMATKLIFSKLKPAVGMGRARVCVSGAAPINREVLEFFAGLDIIVHEVYGQSEGSGPTSFNIPGRTRLGSVGPAIPGCEVKIAEDGEILVRGPNVFSGYYKEPEATAETLVDGWLHSGDLGKFDNDGFLFITGRKKEIIITAGGKNITPKNLEAEIKNSELVNEAVVIGDRRKYLSAVVTLDPEAAVRFAELHNISTAELHKHPLVIAEIQKQVDILNEKVARVEQVKKFRILERNFGIDTGELTPTLKVKRRKVYENFASVIEEMYADDND